jgi:hypothetical protein
MDIRTLIAAALIGGTALAGCGGGGETEDVEVSATEAPAAAPVGTELPEYSRDLFLTLAQETIEDIFYADPTGICETYTILGDEEMAENLLIGIQGQGLGTNSDFTETENQEMADMMIDLLRDKRV